MITTRLVRSRGTFVKHVTTSDPLWFGPHRLEKHVNVLINRFCANVSLDLLGRDVTSRVQSSSVILARPGLEFWKRLPADASHQRCDFVGISTQLVNIFYCTAGLHETTQLSVEIYFCKVGLNVYNVDTEQLTYS